MVSIGDDPVACIKSPIAAGSLKIWMNSFGIVALEYSFPNQSRVSKISLMASRMSSEVERGNSRSSWSKPAQAASVILCFTNLRVPVLYGCWRVSRIRSSFSLFAGRLVHLIEGL